MKKVTPQEYEQTAKRISKTLEDILPERIKFNQGLELEVNQQNKKYEGFIGKLKNVCTAKYKKEIEKHSSTFSQNYKKDTLYLEEISREVTNSSKIDKEILENIKLNLEKKRKQMSWKDPNLYEILFQYKEFVEVETKPYFETSSYDIIGFGMLDDTLNNLIKYSSSPHVKPIVNRLIKKIGEIYNISADREIHGNKTIAYRSFSGGSLSTTNQCINLLKRIGQSLELSEEDVFSLAKIKRTYSKLSEYNKLRE